MCVNCARFRGGHGRDGQHGVGADRSDLSVVASCLDIPISRARLLAGLGAGLAGLATGGLWRASADAAGLPYIVLIVLDGARPEYLAAPGLPHVAGLIRHGTQYTNAFAGILESETPSAHVSITTGSEPRLTGIPSFWWGTRKGRRVSLFSPDTVRAGEIEKIIRRSRTPTLAGMVHAQSRSAKVVALSGSKYYAADAIGGPDADVTMYFSGTSNGHYAPTYIPGHAPPSRLLNNQGLTARTTRLPLGVENHLAMKLAAESFRHLQQQVTLINLPEFDWPLGHVNGGIIDPSGIQTLMHGFDDDLARLQDTYRQAGVLDRTIFVLMADHGMMPLRHTVSAAIFAEAVARAGTSLVTEADSSAVYLWLTNKARASQVARNIAELGNPHIQATYARVRAGNDTHYVRESFAGLPAGTDAANQYLLETFNRPNAPDVVAVLKEGVGCEPAGQAGWKADHGGTSWEAQHIPLVLAGPGIRSGHVSSYPARLIDVAPTLLEAMGASYRGMQGIPLADALLRASGADAQRQRAMSRSLIPVVTALQHQSHTDLSGS
ncbi:MAG TPA: alkaline phosphatase family protein [Chloroflexota bacterium]|nr:alkaline phosphatase family protein [Chloroflexota bacterium]